MPLAEKHVGITPVFPASSGNGRKCKFRQLTKMNDFLIPEKTKPFRPGRPAGFCRQAGRRHEKRVSRRPATFSRAAVKIRHTGRPAGITRRRYHRFRERSPTAFAARGDNPEALPSRKAAVLTPHGNGRTPLGETDISMKTCIFREKAVILQPVSDTISEQVL